MTYKEIVDLGLNRNTARKLLNELVRRVIVKENREQWTLGKKLFHSLTEQGKRYFLSLVIEDFTRVLELVENVTGRFASDYEALEQWRQAIRERTNSKPSSAILKRGYYTKDETEKELKRCERYHKPLGDGLKNIMEIFLFVESKAYRQLKKGRTTKRPVIGITKEGKIKIFWNHPFFL